jgi:hypothetical protein
MDQGAEPRIKVIKGIKEPGSSEMLMAHAYNPSYLGGRDQED